MYNIEPGWPESVLDRLKSILGNQGHLPGQLGVFRRYWIITLSFYAASYRNHPCQGTLQRIPDASNGHPQTALLEPGRLCVTFT
jgi:hypothetical protein